jgi:tetratricopeptide (TPR) repeat protein
MEEAARLDPNNPLVAVVLGLLYRLGRLQETEARAEGLLDAPAASPDALYQAANILLRRGPATNGDDETRALERLVTALRRALHADRGRTPQERIVPDLGLRIVFLLGVCLMRLGQTQAAVKAYDEALAQYPNHAELLTARGIANYEKHHAAALEDFTRAAQGGATSVWPYLALAQEAMNSRDYHRAWPLCLQGIQIARAPEVVRATLYEWLAISQDMLGQPSSVVLANFDQALDLDPTSDRIKQNRDVALTRSREGRRTTPAWSVSKPVSPWVLRRSQEGLAQQPFQLLSRAEKERIAESLMTA